MMQAAIQRQSDEASDVVSLKGGASGAEALMYMNIKRRRRNKC